jgi:hypothetical protein
MIIESIIYLFLCIGLYFMILNIYIPTHYMHLLLFFTIKILIDYRKCTVSYLECKIRNVPKEEGYINYLINGLSDIKYHRDFGILLFIVCIFIIYDIIKRFS